jgi:hypothetical protein
MSEHACLPRCFHSMGTHLIIMLTTSIALSLACLAFVAYDRYTVRHDTSRYLPALADMTGRNATTALSMNDVASAIRTLKVLGVDQHFMAASIYTPDGSEFATYVRDAVGRDVTFSASHTQGASPGGHRVVAARPILFDDEQVGSITTQYDLQSVHDRLKRYASITAMVLIGATLVAFGVSLPL